LPTKQKIAELLVEIGMDSKDAAKAAEKMEKKLKDLEKAAKDAEEGVDDASESLEKFSKVGSAADKIANGLGIALLGVAGVVGGLAKEVLTIGGRFESLAMQLKTTTGSAEAAQRALAFIKDFAKNTPFQVEEITEAFVKLQNFGIDPTTRTLTAFGDFAAAFGKTLDQVVEAVTDATTGEFERLKELGIKTSSQGDKVIFTFRGVATEVEKNSKSIQEFLTSIAEQNFGGAMADQMGTLGGVVSNLQDAMAEFFDSVAQMGPLEEFKTLVGDLRDAAAGRGGLAEGLARTLTAAIRGVRRLLSGNLIPTLEKLVAVLEFVINNFGKLAALFVGAKLVGGIASLTSALGGLGLSISALTGPVGIAMAALTALGILAVKVTNQINQIPKVPRPPPVDDKSKKLAPVAAPKLEKAQNQLDALRRQIAANPALATGTAQARIKNLEKRIEVLQDEVVRETAARAEKVTETQLALAEKRIEARAELEAVLGITPGEFPTGEQQRQLDIGTEALNEGRSVEEAIQAIGEAEVEQEKATGFGKVAVKKPKKAKAKKRVTSPTTVAEFFGAASRGELGRIAEKTPSTREIEPTVAVDITNNHFAFKDTFHITGTTDPEETGKQVVARIKAEFDRRLAAAGQQLQTNLVR
jgi:hypothetical protein